MFSLMPWRKEKNGGLMRRGEHPFATIRREFETLFDRFLGQEPLFLTRWPAVEEFGRGWGMEVKETEKEVVVEVEAPGFEPGEFDVRLSDGTLWITAEHVEKKEGKEEEAKSERRLERYVTLPVGVDPEKVAARYHNGLLELHLTKKEETKGRKIEVKCE